MTPVRSIDLTIDVPAPESGWHIAVSVHLPTSGSDAACPVLVAFPGGGYNRRYFDLPVPGFSQAEHHTRQGTVVVSVDHLGVGDSSVPPLETTTLATVAAVNHAAVTAVLGRLRAGAVAPGIPPVEISAVVGAGQSLGGHVLAVMQAEHRTFDGVAMLGSSMVATRLPVRPGAPRATIPSGTPVDEAARIMLADTDWPWVFHWDAGSPDTETDTETDTGAAPAGTPEPPHDHASLVAADLAGGVPARRTAPPWGSLTSPGLGRESMRPGVLRAHIARIDVPVLLASGERDVCGPPAEELAGFGAARDLTAFVVPNMAHMHNFAQTRLQLWERLDEFVVRVTRSAGRPPAPTAAATAPTAATP